MIVDEEQATLDNVEIPKEVLDKLPTIKDGKAVQDHLHARRIECPVKTVRGRLYVRISAAAYNDPEEYERLGRIVHETDWSAVV